MLKANESGDKRLLGEDMLANNVMAAEITNGNDQGLIGLTLYRSKRMPMACL